MTFCTSCGKKLNPGATRCEACGTAVLASHSTPTENPNTINRPTSEDLQTRTHTPSKEVFLTNSGATIPLSSLGVQVGRVLGGRYQLDQVIGSGGMGEIYRARRLHIGDTVAVKVLRSDTIESETSRQRFYREARAAALLKHPNAVVIHDFGEDDDGTAYIVMELLEGRSLRQLLADAGPISAARAYSIIRQACAALDAGHRNGIIHRDIKPDNFILLNSTDGDDHIKILDFGIAKVLEKATDTLSLEQRLTNVGSVIGTPHYMSPEQCQGEEADARSDIYSLGIVLYELLTGVAPFLAKTPTGVAIKQVTEKPRPLRELQPSLSEAVQAVVLKAMEKNPDDRQQTAMELAREFEAAVRSDDPALRAELTGEYWRGLSVDHRDSQSTAILSKGSDTGSQPVPVTSSSPPQPPSFDQQSFETKLSELPFATDHLSSTATSEQQSAVVDLKTQTIGKVDTPLPDASKPGPKNKQVNRGKNSKTGMVKPVPSVPSATDQLRTDPFGPDGMDLQDDGQNDDAATGLLGNSSAPTMPVQPVSSKLVSAEQTKTPSEIPAKTPAKVSAKTPAPASVTASTQAPAKSRMPLFIGIGVVALVIAGLVGWWMMRSGESKPAAVAVAPATTIPTATPVAQTSPIAKSDYPELPAPEGMVYVLGGALQVGRDDGEENERPAHTVTVAPFFIDRTEVTNEQYQKFIDATKHAAPPNWNGNRFPAGAERLPVTDVTWEDANDYAKWAERRLPTEEEWEFAARGPEARLYPWGDKLQPDTANVTATKGEQREIMPVGQFINGASTFGVLDLIGNVWEWTASDYAAYPNGKIKSAPGFSNLKVIRGGSFESEAQLTTATLRRGWPATRKDWPRGATPDYTKTGFRTAQDFKH